MYATPTRGDGKYSVDLGDGRVEVAPAGNHWSFDQLFLYFCGVISSRLRKALMKWLAVSKPTAAATSLMERSVVRKRRLAFAMRTAVR